jgi:hypothetical protein
MEGSGFGWSGSAALLLIVAAPRDEPVDRDQDADQETHRQDETEGVANHPSLYHPYVGQCTERDGCNSMFSYSFLRIEDGP